jgi:RND family efflux transporter MFP subunit
MNRLLKIALGLAIIGIGCTAAWYFVTHKPYVSRQKPTLKANPVDIIAASPSTVKATIEAMGTVVPSREITLRSEVSGQVVEIEDQFTPGGRLATGQTAVRIDPRDHQIQVSKAKSTLSRARADLQLEQGKQDVARQELAMFQEGGELEITETELALRRPQLEQAQADVQSAEADLRQAELDLQRTTVTVPFNALVTARNVNLGSQVSGQDNLATLAGTDVYWVQASIQMKRLQLLDLSTPNGHPVRIFSQSGKGEWTGRTLRLTGEVDEKTRMATLLISVPDPLNQQGDGQPLMINDYVRVHIQGKTMANIFSLPTETMREGHTLWVMENNSLDIRSVEVAWQDREHVYISQGLAPGDLVVRSSLATPVQGMRLRAAEDGGDE